MSVTSEASQKCVTETKKDGNLLLEKNSVQNFCPYHFRRCFRFELEMIFSPEKYFRFKVFLLLENVHLKIFLFRSWRRKQSARAKFFQPGCFSVFLCVLGYPAWVSPSIRSVCQLSQDVLCWMEFARWLGRTHAHAHSCSHTFSLSSPVVSKYSSTHSRAHALTHTHTQTPSHSLQSPFSLSMLLYVLFFLSLSLPQPS